MDHSPDQPAVETRAVARRMSGASAPGGTCEVLAAAPVAQTLQAFNEHGYDGWPMLEQDRAITADEPAVTRAPMLSARHSIALNNPAHTTEEIDR
ncbi:MAG: hypothetical protein WAU75_16450 [Solirubrobacteraceae bacterium]